MPDTKETIHSCRICSQPLFSTPLLRYENMPKSAQALPSVDELQLDRGITMEVWQCSGCGLVQLASPPVPYYREVIRAAGFSPEMKAFRQRQFNNFITKNKLENKKIIEIGCGHGEYLEILQQYGSKAYGLEYSEEAVKKCCKNGLKVSQGFADSSNYKLQGGPFSAFFIFSFLEHLPDPNSTLAGIRNNLENDGIGIVEVPNFDMVLKKNLFTEFVSDHLLYFTKETLTTTLATNGFEILDCDTVWYDYIISAKVEKRKPTGLNQFSIKQTHINHELSTYLDKFSPETVAIWGAGHQALAAIALLNLSGKVRFVVDSAPFKQGCYTPATHIEIVPPEALDSANIKTVIIMAASYSDEVANIVKQRYNKMNIAILRDNGLEIVGN